MNGKVKNILKQKFGKWTVIEFHHIDKKSGAAYWTCKCDCGIIKPVNGSSLRSKRSSGCFKCSCLSDGESSFNITYSEYKKSARKRGYDFLISKEYFKKLTQGDCFYCGAKPKNIKTHPGIRIPYIYNGIDRVDNSKGYIKGNVVPCCKECNTKKKAVDVNIIKKAYRFLFKS